VDSLAVAWVAACLELVVAPRVVNHSTGLARA
jgi:hypothetical protein